MRKKMNCECCGLELVEDDGYEAVGRCRNTLCKKFNIPIIL